MPTSETLRSVIEAGRTSRRLDELSAARVIGKAAQQVHASQQKAGAGKAVGPISPAAIGLAQSGEVSLSLAPASAGGYAAPEQASGAPGDRRSDVFSLGVVMWEALTHLRLFEAMNDAAVKAAINEREIKPPSEVNANIPVELSAICMRALARNPADRYQSAKSMGVEIEEFLEEAGYADNDDQIAAFMRELGQPKVEKKVTLPPATRIAPASTPPATEAALPSVLKPPAPSPTATASAQAASASALPAPSDKTSTAPGLGPSVLVTPAPAASARTANGTAPPPGAMPNPPLVPMAPVLPGSSIVAGAAKADAEKNGEAKADAAKADAHAAKADAGKTNGEAATLDAAKPRMTPVPGLPAVPPGADLPAAAPAQPATASPPPAQTPSPATAHPALSPSQTVVGIGIIPTAPATTAPSSAIGAPPASPATSSAAASTAAPAPSAAPNAPMGPGESSPDPASVVALPGAPRESKDVLAGWGWGTDAHEAIDDEDVHAPNTNSRKLLMYLIGGGVVFAAMVAIIAFGFGGSKKKHPQPPPAAVTQEGSAAGLVPDTTGSANAAGSAVDTTGAVAAADTTGSATGSAAAADTTGAVDTTGSAAVATTTGSTGAATPGTTPTGSAAVATTGPVNPYPDTPDTTKPDTTKPATTTSVTKPDTTKPDAIKPDKTAKVEAPKPDKIAKATPEPTKTHPDKTTKVTRPDTTKPTRPDTRVAKTTKPDRPAKPDKAKEGEAEASYKAGIMAFARGDTTGSLASLRTSLAANPNYAPTWRGLGLVFEKLGEKDQARAAFKRYLQLAPSAGDAEQIRSRLERLGS